MYVCMYVCIIFHLSVPARSNGFAKILAHFSSFFIYLSIYLSIYLAITVYLSIQARSYQCIYMSAYFFIYLSIYLSFYLSIRLIQKFVSLSQIEDLPYTSQTYMSVSYTQIKT